jgi:hypothetical protein
MKKAIMVLLGGLLLVAAFTPSVTAATGPTVEEYNTVEAVTVTTYPVPLDVTYDDGFTALAASNCTHHQRGYQVDAKNHFGNTIWSFGGFLEDCTKGGQVIHKNWGACWGWVSDNILNRWEFKGCEIEDQSKQDLPRNYIWRQWRGHFKSCVYIAGCQTKNPWVYIGGRGDGTFGTNGGAG